jgi:AcrR family transcriptional regulator
MDAIAREAGYSRASIYRHFPTRERLVEALVQRTTKRHMARMLDRLPPHADLVSVLVESMVIVATELIRDPLLKTISDQTDDRTVAHMLAHDAGLAQLVETVVQETLNADGGTQFRPGINAKELAQFLIGTNISLLLGVIPGIDDAETARRYITVFVLPAIVVNPPRPTTT